MTVFDVNDVIPLGFSCAADADIEIRASEWDGLFDSQPFFLRETFNTTPVTYSYYDIRQVPHTFTTTTAVTDDMTRFQIVFTKPGLTQVVSTQCGGNIPGLSSQIYADLVPGASAYNWLVTNTSTGVQHIHTTSIRSFSINSSAFPQFFAAHNTTYTVAVQAVVGGVGQGYGHVCTVTTASPVTQLTGNQCTGTYVLPTLQTYLTANIISHIQGYEWEVTNMTTDEVRSFTTPLRTFRFSNQNLFPPAANFVTPDTEYCIRVRAVNTPGNTSLEYGEECCIRTPETSPRFCEDNQVQDSKDSQAFVFPNPYNNTFSVNYQTQSKSPVNIKIFDSFGKLLEDIDALDISELEKTKLGSGYASGLYIVVLHQDNSQETIKILKE